MIKCKLNDTFKQALTGKHWEYALRKASSYFNEHERCFKNGNLEVRLINATSSFSCCGLSELNYNILNSTYIATPEVRDLSDDEWRELIAKYIKKQTHGLGGRVLICGIPKKVKANSQYSIAFYKRLFETLLDFGFVQLGNTYKNLTSKNNICVVAGQL